MLETRQNQMRTGYKETEENYWRCIEILNIVVDRNARRRPLARNKREETFRIEITVTSSDMNSKMMRSICKNRTALKYRVQNR